MSTFLVSLAGAFHGTCGGILVTAGRTGTRMQCVILAGGRGTRLAEETEIRPKPMVSIGGRPILWHIMKIYAHHGISDFIICLGYKGYVIKEYFNNYFLHMADVTIDMASNEVTYHDSRSEPWRVTLVDTGDQTMTGGRLKRIARYLDGETFCLTYGDGLADIDIAGETAFHAAHGRAATMTLVRPSARFGSAVVEGDRVVGFEEKAQSGTGLVNGGFFVLEPAVLDVIDGDGTSWEEAPMQRLVAADDLRAWCHDGFWQPMDTLRERQLLEQLWSTGNAPWKLWP